jgi:hypothetical protein
MNYYKLFDRTGFKRQTIAAVPSSNYRGPVEYLPLDERKGYENTHRYYVSWSYRINDDITIWVNTFKMSDYSAWLIDNSNEDKIGRNSGIVDSAVKQIYIGGRHSTSTLDDNMWESILYSLPEKYQYVGQLLLRQKQIDRLL